MIFCTNWGEQFAIIFPTHAKVYAVTGFKQIRTAIEDMKLPYQEEIICFTVSIG